MITIIFAPPRTGKTALMTHLLNEYAFDTERNRKMQKAVLDMQAQGFKVSLPEHCVSTNYECEFRKFGYSRRKNYKINPFRLGYKNGIVKTHFLFPYQVIGITESQKYLDSHMALYFPWWQSRYYEQHGHYDHEILLDTQRPELINANVRALSKFVEVLEQDRVEDKFGRMKSMSWHVREIPNEALYNRYVESGKTLKMPEKVIKAEYDTFLMYDHQNCRPKNFDGHFEEDFTLEFGETPEENIDGYIRYLEKLDDEMPDGFYQKRVGNDKKKEQA